MTYTKASIIEAVAETNGLSRARATELTEILLKMIKNTLVSGEDLLISGFG